MKDNNIKLLLLRRRLRRATAKIKSLQAANRSIAVIHNRAMIESRKDYEAIESRFRALKEMILDHSGGLVYRAVESAERGQK